MLLLLVICFSQYNKYIYLSIIFLISFSNFPDVLPDSTCAIAIGNL